MIKWFLIVTFFFIAVACSLSGSQERNLHKALTAYMNAKNNGSVVSYAAYTYPPLVFEYKQKGDVFFQHKFELENYSLGLAHFENSIMREVESSGKMIHVHFSIDKYENQSIGSEPEKSDVIAISENEGKTWFFLEKADYINKNNCPKLKRMIFFENKN